MKKRILATLCALSIILVNFSLLFSVSVSADDALPVSGGGIKGGKPGNIFSMTDPLTFSQDLRKNIEGNVGLQYQIDIFDEENNNVCKKIRPRFTMATETGTYSVTISDSDWPTKKCGFYTLKLSVRETVGTEYQDVSLTTKFSICMPGNENNRNPQFGYNEPMVRTGYGDPAVASQLMGKVGAKWHREGVEWSAVEQVKGEYSISQSSKNRLQGIKNSGLQTICILKGINSLYNSKDPSGNAPSSDEEITAFANYCSYVATELGEWIDHFEVWNEWNNGTFNPTGEAPETYAKVLKAAYEAIKAVNPGYYVIGCATAGFDPTWIRRVLVANDGEAYMDILSMHDYAFTTEDGFTETDFVENFGDLKDLLDEYSLDIPVWLTECGFSTYDNENAAADFFVDGCSEDVQLNSIVMLNAVNKSYGLFDNVIQHCLYDKNDTTQIESCWGVLNCWSKDVGSLTNEEKGKFVASSAKPAYLGLAAMNYFIGGNADFVSKTVDEENRRYAFEFYNNNLEKPVVLLINGGISNNSTRTVDLGCTEVKLYDKYGNLKETKTSETGQYEIATSTEPLYAVATSGAKIRVNSYIDYNTGIATVSGTTATPYDLVSLMLVTDGEPVTTYDASRIEYLAQDLADGNGDFSFEFAPEDAEGDYQVYVNSKARSNKNIQDIVFKYSASGIKLFKNDTQITSLSQLSAGDSVNVKIGGAVAAKKDNPQILVAQYKDGKVADVYAVAADGDASVAGDEITANFTVGSNIDEIKVMYWKMNSLMSIIGSYKIQ